MQNAILYDVTIIIKQSFVYWIIRENVDYEKIEMCGGKKVSVYGKMRKKNWSKLFK